MKMQMHAIATELGDDWAGPYTDVLLLKKTLAIVRQLDPGAEIISRETDPYREQIEASLQPYQILVEIIGGEPQLPATVRLCWPPAATEGIQEGTSEYTRYFCWARNEKDALLRLARLNKATSKSAAEVIA
jgi:hypothetical protein